MQVKRKKISFLWNFFSVIDEKFAKCNRCKAHLSYRTSTSNLKRHMENKHPNVSLSVIPAAAKNERFSISDIEVEEEDGNTKPEKSPTPEKAPSPFSSDNESLITGNPAPRQPATVKKKSFKKTKVTQEVPYTEGYLDESTYESLKTSYKKSPRTILPRANPQQNPRGYNEPDTHICSSCPCIAAQESEYDKMGKGWASEVKKMTPEQQIFAKRAFAEIIFEGQLGSLSRDSFQVRRVHQTTRTVDDPLVEEEFEFQKN